METAKLFSFVLHIIAGVSTLVAGPVALWYNFKYPRQHKLAGKVFSYAMVFVCVTGVLGWLKRPHVEFFQFLGALSVVVAVQLLTGIRAIQNWRVAQKQWFDYLLIVANVLVSCTMLVRGTDLMLKSGGAVGILFLVFGTSSAIDAYRSIKRITSFQSVSKLDWYLLHISAMVGSFTASTTAFLVQTGHMLPWYLQWFGPTILLVPVTIYFSRKVKAQMQSRVVEQS